MFSDQPLGRIIHLQLDTMASEGPSSEHQVATTIAKRLHTELTIAKKLQVNYVVVKVVDPALYLDKKRIKGIARGTAGVYQDI